MASRFISTKPKEISTSMQAKWNDVASKESSKHKLKWKLRKLRVAASMHRRATWSQVETHALELILFAL